MQSSYTDYDPFCKSNHNDCINLECMKLISAIEMQISEGILLEKISKNCTGRIVIRQYFKSEETNLCSKKYMKKLTYILAFFKRILTASNLAVG